MEESLTPLLISIGTNRTNNNNKIFRILTLIVLTFTITLFLIYELPIENYSSVFKWTLKSEYKNPCNYGPKGPRIYCAVLTHYDNLHRAQAVEKTWGKYIKNILILNIHLNGY